MITIDEDKLAELANGALKDKAKALQIQFRKGAFDLGDDTDKDGGSCGRIMLKKAADCTAEEKSFRRFNDDLLMAGILLSGTQASPERISERIRVMKRYKSELGTYRQRDEFAKAMDAATAGSGGNWVPTGFSSDLIDLIRVESKIANLFLDVPMSQNPQCFPSILSDPSAYKGAENTVRTAGAAGTGKITLTASKIIVPVEFSYELDEDAVFSMITILKDVMSKKLAYAIDDAIVNGDSAATLDSNIPGATAAGGYLRNWIGLRKRAQTQGSSMADLSTFSWANLVALKGLLGKYYFAPSKCAWIYGAVDGGKIEALTNTGGDPLFPNGLPETGAKLMGIPMIPSDVIKENLNNSGVYDGTTTNKTVLVLVRADAYMLGTRGSLLVETDKDIEAQTNKIVASVRKDFEPRQAVTETTVVVGYKIS